MMETEHKVRSSRTTPVAPECLRLHSRAWQDPLRAAVEEPASLSSIYDHCRLVFNEQIRMVIGLSSLDQLKALHH